MTETSRVAHVLSYSTSMSSKELDTMDQ